MSGKKLLDVVALLSASRAVASQHLRIRSQQFEVYSKTSTLAKAVRNARSQVSPSSSQSLEPNLSTRSSKQATTTTASTFRPGSQRIPSPESVKHTDVHARSQRLEGRDQDHTYRTQDGTGTDSIPSEDLAVTQERPGHSPLPDGTIPGTMSNADMDNSRIGQEVFSERSVAEPVKQPLVHDHSRSGGLEPESSARSSIPLPNHSNLEQSGAVQEPSEEMLNQIFHSPKVATLLGRQGRNTAPRPATRSPSSAGQKVASQDHEMHIPHHQEHSATSVDDGGHKSASWAEDEKRNISADAAYQSKNSEIVSEASIGNNTPGTGTTSFEMHESRVPSSRFGRLWQYSGLAASMAFGAAGEGLRRAISSDSAREGSLILSGGNMERLVAKLSKMRGAALKVGQMMSFQDSKMLPAPIREVLQRVQDKADYMPPYQRDLVLAGDLGADWRSLFESFEEKPMAAASIGQVHGAILKSNGRRVAVKVQYPGVADSISADLSNISLLLTASRLLPKGLYLDKTIANARTELAWECDYVREADGARRFRQLLAGERDVFAVPEIFDEACGKQVLTMERMEGQAVTKMQNLDQEQKDWIGTQIMRLCLLEMMDFRFMQTDPNWTNFLYNHDTKKLELLDFGASRTFPSTFINLYIENLAAASRKDREACRELSVQLGYLTGFESETMLNAHVDSLMTLAEPFMEFAPDVYDFKDQTITDRVRQLIPVMIRERLAPPPEETYSLHRKLSGAFLLCSRLGSKVRCKEMFQQALTRWAERKHAEG